MMHLYKVYYRRWQLQVFNTQGGVFELKESYLYDWYSIAAHLPTCCMCEYWINKYIAIIKVFLFSPGIFSDKCLDP